MFCNTEKSSLVVLFAVLEIVYGVILNAILGSCYLNVEMDLSYLGCSGVVVVLCIMLLCVIPCYLVCYDGRCIIYNVILRVIERLTMWSSCFFYYYKFFRII